MHKLLVRQIKRWLPEELQEGRLKSFLEAIDSAYSQADEDRKLLERSLELSSNELSERYTQLKQHYNELTTTKQSLEESVSLLNATLNSTRDGIVVQDENSRVLAVNNVFLEMMGIPRDPSEQYSIELIRQHLATNVKNLDELTQIWEFNKKFPTRPSYCSLELGDNRFIECFSQPRIEYDQAVGRVWSFSDITDIKTSEQQALYHTYHDSLTRLPNRTQFHERLSLAIQRAENSREDFGILFIGLDGFKLINDSVGIAAGDQALCDMAKRIQGELNPRNCLARYGGDEYVVLIENIGSSFKLSLLAEKIRNAIGNPYQLNGQDIQLSASIGISLWPTDGQEAESLLRKADMAMYHAKSRGRNNVQFFAKHIEALTSHRMNIRNSIKKAMEDNEFFLVYQPKIDMRTGELKGVEALIRWQKQDGSVVSPGDFIPAAEENGFIVDIGEWVVEHASRQLQEWTPVCSESFSVAINISGQHFQRGNILATIISALNKFAIRPHQLEIEITESTIMGNIEEATKTLNAFRKLGITCAIDDFGTGYSSLNYLKRLPVNTLKIDKVFIDDIRGSDRDLALAEAIITLAHHLDLTVVAEGVEDEHTADLLREKLCDVAQGYLFSRPVSAEAISILLDDQHSVAGEDFAEGSQSEANN